MSSSSSSGRKTKTTSDNEKLVNLKAILGDGIPDSRMIQVLEASNGSLEHAIEIYFSQMQQQQPSKPSTNSGVCDVSSPEPSIDNPDRVSNNDTKKHGNNNTIVNKKRRQKLSSPDNSERKGGAKQARLDSFFSRNPNTSATTIKPVPFKNEFDDKEQRQTKSPVTNIPNAGDSFPALIPKTIYSKRAPKKEKANVVDPASFLTFKRLCETLQEMSDTTKRLVKLGALETLIREIVNAEEEVSVRARALSSALELVLGGTPTLNVSGSAVSKALQTSLGISRSQISKAYRTNGDIGDCAAMFFQTKTHFVINSHRRKLSVIQVNKGLCTISETDGRDAKQHILLGLLRNCQSKMECRFLVRLLIRNMRIGANIKTILAALAMAMVAKDGSNTDDKTCKLEQKDAITLVQKTYDICPSIPKIVTALLEGGLKQMKQECSIQVMTPIAPMLAHPIHSLEEIKTKMGDCGNNEATMEWKYDGMRCQAHFDGSKFRLFSRHMLDMTDQFPDVAKFLKEALKQPSMSFVIDAEIVGVQGQGSDSHLLPFQDLSTRRKKMDDGNGIRVKVFAFDIMLLNGKSLVNEELFERKARLYELFEETNDFLFVSSRKLTAYDEDKIKVYLSEAVEHGAEGLMIKLLGRKSVFENKQDITTNEKPTTEVMNSLYEAGTRSHSWLKVKRDYVAGYSDTIDVVPIGAWRGSGRKAQKSFLSPILLAVYDDEEDVYRSICRCMTFTDAMYESMREFYFNGTEYPACLDSQPAENSIEKPEQNPNGEEDASVEDDKSCDGENDDIEKGGEENQLDSNNEKLEDCTIETERVHCFPNRPSSAFVITNESPPIWFKPMEVFEVAFADLSLSRQHTAAAGLVDEEGRGVALRFPRFKRRRPDKTPEQATTSIEVAQLFAKQSKIKNSSRSFQPNRSK